MKSLYALIGTTLLSFACGLSAQETARVSGPIFKGEAQSTGWIPFESESGSGIFLPATINGHSLKVLLVTGLPLSDIDQNFAASIGLTAEKEGAEEVVHHLNLQIGSLQMNETDASVMDFGPLSRHSGRDVRFILGDDAFRSLVVDIDFPHHRICFRKATDRAKPANAVEVPLKRIEGLPLIPISIEGSSPVEFEMGIGNSGDALIYQTYYESHGLLEGRPLSKRLAAGSGGITPEPVGTLRQIQFAGFSFESVPAAFIPTTLAGTKSDIIAGDLGLPVLARFRLIVDYPHERLWAIPDRAALRQPFAKDRLGLWLKKNGSDLVVEFVAPGSPAERSGLAEGEKIISINGRKAQDWSQLELGNLRYDPKVTSISLTLSDSRALSITPSEYF